MNVRSVRSESEHGFPANYLPRLQSYKQQSYKLQSYKQLSKVAANRMYSIQCCQLS